MPVLTFGNFIIDQMTEGKAMHNARPRRRWRSATTGTDDQFHIRRRALIREAGQAFSKNGFHNTSLDDVAKALGVTKPALYYYVKDKNEILFECHSQALDLGEQAKEYAAAANGSALERISLWLKRYMELINSELGNHAVLAEPVTSLKPEQRRVIVKRRREFDDVMRLWLSEAMAAGEIPQGHVGLKVTFFMGAVNGLSRWFDPQGEMSGEEIANIYTKMIIAALRTDTVSD